jgi:hypothetical protein
MGTARVLPNSICKLSDFVVLIDLRALHS